MISPRQIAARIAAPRGVEDIEVTSLSVSSVVEPQSVPSRISVVLVEEAKVRGTEYSVSPGVDQEPCWPIWDAVPV